MTRKEIDQNLRVFNNRSGLSLTIDKLSTGYRLQNGERYVSPRLKAKAMADYLETMVNTLDLLEVKR